MVTALKSIEPISRSKTWKDLLALWQLYESALGFPDGRGKSNLLSKTKRPEEISLWLKNGRKWDNLPQVDDSKEFGEAWKAWWADIQPEWRDFTWPPAHDEEDHDWAVLRRGGPNAMFLVILGLGFWLSSLKDIDGNEDVKIGINDVAWVMQSAVDRVENNPDSSNKRRRID